MTCIETSKNTVVLEADRVVKTFKPGPKAVKRYRRAVKSMTRLAGVAGIPVLLEVRPAQLQLVMTRLPGEQLTRTPTVPDAAFQDLRRVVMEMLERGVARHSMPPRDIIVGPDGKIGLVDFERSTLRGWRYSPIWGGACLVTRFHLRRLIGDRAPHLLSRPEAGSLRIQRRISDWYHAFILLRRRIRSG